MAGRWKKFDDLEGNLEKKLDQAIIKGGNETLEEAVKSAKANHPGWATKTGAAEKSIQVTSPMHRDGHKYRGKFGSKGVKYFIWLEIGTRYHAADHTLRRAADIAFPRVWDKIRSHL